MRPLLQTQFSELQSVPWPVQFTRFSLSLSVSLRSLLLQPPSRTRPTCPALPLPPPIESTYSTLTRTDRAFPYDPWSGERSSRLRATRSSVCSTAVFSCWLLGIGAPLPLNWGTPPESGPQRACQRSSSKGEAVLRSGQARTELKLEPSAYANPLANIRFVLV